MSSTIPEPARQLGVELELRFARDAQLTTRRTDAQQRLQPADDRLWTGLHRDDIATIYGEHLAAVQIAVAHDRSEFLDAPDPLQEAEHARDTTHRALIDLQSAAVDRRQLAAEVGELADAPIGTLAGAGWSENDAGGTSVRDCPEGLAGSGS